MYQRTLFARRNAESQEKRLDELKKRERFLSKEIYTMQSQQGIEREARHLYDVGKKGEELVVLVDRDIPDKKPEVIHKGVLYTILHFLHIR